MVALTLSACVIQPDLRPNPYLKSEQFMQQGLQAYEQNNFSDAQRKFSAALELYRSFDNDNGIALSQANLAETALAIDDFVQAELYLNQLKKRSTYHSLNVLLKRKLILLDVKLHFEQQNYHAALAALQPLIAELNAQKIVDNTQMNVLAMQARLEVLISPLTPSVGLVQFETALTQISLPSPHYQALLKRTLALIALKQGHYQKAIILLTEALTYYKEQANRRAIAACLEELATIEFAQSHTRVAQEYLQKALLIWKWLKNDYKSNQIQKKLH